LGSLGADIALTSGIKSKDKAPKQSGGFQTDLSTPKPNAVVNSSIKMGKQQQYTVQLPDSSDVSGAVEPYVPAGQLALQGNDALTPYQMASMQQAIGTKAGAVVAVPQRPLMLSQQRAIDAACTALASVMPLGTQNVSYFACQFAADKLIQAGRAVTKDSLLSIVKSTPSLLRKARDYIKKFGGKKAARRSINSSYTQPIINAQNHVVYAQPPHKAIRVATPKIQQTGGFMSNYGIKAGDIFYTRAGPKKVVSVKQDKMPKKFSNRATIAAPAAKSKRLASRPPRILKKGKGLTIAHSEMIGSIVSHGTTLTYKCDGYVNNPGRFGTYPWLSSIAGNFDRYILRKCVINFISNQPTNIAGRVGIGMDFDSTDPVPADRNEFFSLTHHAQGAPWDSLSLVVPCDQKPKFINSHTLSDSKLIDSGSFLFMSDQIVALNSNLGDITVDYVVELLEPQQAIYTTQYITGQVVEQAACVANPSLFTITGPLIGLKTNVYDASTTTVEFTINQGYYQYFTHVHDVANSSPTLALTTHGAVAGAKHIAQSGVNNGTDMGFFKFTSAGTIKFVLGGAASFSVLEGLAISLTRVSAAAYNAGVTSMADVTGTY